MDSPWLTVVLSGIYIIFSLSIGPALMKNREAFKLTRPMQAYNLVQVVLSAYIVHESWTSGWGGNYNWGREFRDVLQPLEEVH